MSISERNHKMNQIDDDLKSVSYTVSFKCASYDNLPTEDDLVTAIVEGLEENFPNLTSDLKVKINSKTKLQNGKHT